MAGKENASSGGRRNQSSGGAKKSNDAGIMDNNFILLDELVYAPLHALAESNQKLRAHVIDFVKSMGSVKQNGQEEVIHLDNMNLAYDQVRQENEDGYSLDNLQVQIPLLSVVPITNLMVEKAEITFATEVRAESDPDGKVRINGRICSPEQRDSNFLPRVSYHMEVKSIPATEGVMRITDMLSSNQMAKQLDTTPVTIDGNLSTQEQKNTWQEISEYKRNVKKLRQLYQKVTESLKEQEKLYQISHDADPEETYAFNRQIYLKAQSDIMNQMMELQEKIMMLELKNGLDENRKSKENGNEKV
ncbi:MAG: DUF2589 domain-containing protein [Lachnospiraceae bacterium]|nr:DUF2589 domain-containing protein [Lachnospiraceae bacterium]